MPGASEQTRRVKIVNANWVAGPDGDHGRFEVMMVTEDDQRHVAAPSPEAMTALIALTRADTVLLWDPAGRTLIAANLVGRMPWTECAEPSPPVRCPGGQT
jgi:predicted nucleic acid-binding Zn ribbon protein